MECLMIPLAFYDFIYYHRNDYMLFENYGKCTSMHQTHRTILSEYINNDNTILRNCGKNVLWLILQVYGII